MIRKIIHYCWFGGNDKSDGIHNCISTWHKYNNDYQFIEWNEHNFDINKYEYTKLAYENKCYSKVSNFVRMYVLHKYGGIYLDTDITLYKNLDPLLYNTCFFGIEYNKKYPFYENDFRTTLFGTAIIGSEKNHPTIGRILDHFLTKKWSIFEQTAESNSVLLITNLFKNDIILII